MNADRVEALSKTMASVASRRLRILATGEADAR
jgi:hypothetical protein